MFGHACVSRALHASEVSQSRLKHTITMHVGVWVFWVTTALSAGASGSFAAARASHSHSDAEAPATIQFASVFESSNGVNPVLQQEQWVAVWGNSSSIGEKSDSHCNRLQPLGRNSLCANSFGTWRCCHWVDCATALRVPLGWLVGINFDLSGVDLGHGNRN